MRLLRTQSWRNGKLTVQLRISVLDRAFCFSCHLHKRFDLLGNTRSDNRTGKLLPDKAFLPECPSLPFHIANGSA